MKKLSKVFRIVASNLGPYSHEASFVCCAIDNVEQENRITQAEASEARSQVKRLLGEHFTVSRWLAAQGFDEVFMQPTEILLDYRRRWVAHIVATLEGEGR